MAHSVATATGHGPHVRLCAAILHAFPPFEPQSKLGRIFTAPNLQRRKLRQGAIECATDGTGNPEDAPDTKGLTCYMSG